MILRFRNKIGNFTYNFSKQKDVSQIKAFSDILNVSIN